MLVHEISIGALRTLPNVGRWVDSPMVEPGAYVVVSCSCRFGGPVSPVMAVGMCDYYEDARIALLVSEDETLWNAMMGNIDWGEDYELWHIVQGSNTEAAVM